MMKCNRWRESRAQGAQMPGGRGGGMTGALYSCGYGVGRQLSSAIAVAGASEAELAALWRLERGEAELVDLERLRPLAVAAGLPWGDLYPELEPTQKGDAE